MLWTLQIGNSQAGGQKGGIEGGWSWNWGTIPGKLNWLPQHKDDDDTIVVISMERANISLLIPAFRCKIENWRRATMLMGVIHGTIIPSSCSNTSK